MKEIIMIIMGAGLLVSSCSNENKSAQIENQLIGAWSYFSADSSYIEVYVDSTRINFYSDEDGYKGPFRYSLHGNTIQFNSIEYEVTIESCERIELRNLNYNLNLRKIDCIQRNPNKLKDINPYYLRRCATYVNLGRMTVIEALVYLNSKGPAFEADIEEEVVDSNFFAK